MDEHDRQAFRVEQIDHVEMFVPDRRTAAAWYEQALGLTVCPDYEHWAEDPSGPLMISSDGGSTKLALFEGEPQGERETAGFHLVGFRVSGRNFMRFLERLGRLTLVDHRGRTVTATSPVDHGRAVSLYFNDPWGHRLELTTYDVDAVTLASAESKGGEQESIEVEIESIEATDGDTADGDLPDASSEPSKSAPWMCHRCSKPIPAEQGVVCSSCYRSTCRQCVDTRSTAEPLCLDCA